MSLNSISIIVFFFFLILGLNTKGQSNDAISVEIIKKNAETPPDKVVNIPFFIKNNSADTVVTEVLIDKPMSWSLATKISLSQLKPNEQKFQVLSVRIPKGCFVGKYAISIVIVDSESGVEIAKGVATISVTEFEKVSLQLLDSDENIMAGEAYVASFLLVNQGNTEKNIFLETLKCDIEGEVNVTLKPGESKKIVVNKQTSKEVSGTRTEYITLAALVGGNVKDRIFRPVMIFPVKSFKKDLFFRYPVDASISYLGTNADGTYHSAYQFELSGNGSLDLEGKHRLEFLVRAPDNSDLSYFGSYDQYYISYASKNLEVTVGEKAYQFTPLTESSRYGMGVENKIMLNNGLSAGFIYVKPRFYEEISNELAFYTGYEKENKTKLNLFLIQKKRNDIEDLTYLMSFGSSLQPFPKTSLDFEVSRGFIGDVAGNALRASINTQFSIFSMQGAYYNVGENYPGYYSSSVFYSGSLSARLSRKINVGVSARQDYTNAELDTFFVTAPFTRSFQYFMGYSITPNTNLRVYWSDNEQKDRLSEQKFDYRTRSVNAQFQQKINRLSYSLLGAYGKTENFLFSEENGKQKTYRVSSSLTYRFSSKLAVKTFGSYSNLNSYVSGEDRNVTVGMSINGTILKKLKASFSVQNAYDIEDYYRNRNLMQLNLDYKISKNHQLAFRTYYTLFQEETEEPELYLSATYKYTFGIPLKQVIKAGDVVGRLVDSNSLPLKGIKVQFLNKTTITDKNGEFEFRTIAPGVYILNIDRSKFGIDEMPDMPDPIMIEIIEDNETIINIGMTRGAKLTGSFSLKESNEAPVELGEEISLSNIVVELLSDFKHYRVATNSRGEFSFPMVLPRTWSLKVYENTIPKGFLIEKKEFLLDFKPGEQTNFQIDLKKKKRNIIFKSQNFSLSNSGMGGLKSLKTNPKEPAVQSKVKEEVFYSVQIGAFSKKLKPTSAFFKGSGFDFEEQIDNLYKYYMGRFGSMSEAEEMAEKLRTKFKGVFVVEFENGVMRYIID